jgi:hypothetical protein
MEMIEKEIVDYFQKNNYVVIRQFLDKNLANLLYSYCLTRVQQVDFKSMYAKETYDARWDGQFGDEQAPYSFNAYGDPMMDTLLSASTEMIEKFTGLNLIPEYTYWRLYVKDEELLRHKDRESCEISTTLCLGYNTSNLNSEEYEGYDWPMFVEGQLIEGIDGIPLHLKPGDMIIYKGCEVEHWREKFKGLNHAQVFMHYNDASGPFKIKNDGRPIIGIPKYYQALT